jgi:hypothetical protein
MDRKQKRHFISAASRLDGLNQVTLYRRVSIRVLMTQSKLENSGFYPSFVQQAIFGDEFV